YVEAVAEVCAVYAAAVQLLPVRVKPRTGAIRHPGLARLLRDVVAAEVAPAAGLIGLVVCPGHTLPLHVAALPDVDVLRIIGRGRLAGWLGGRLLGWDLGRNCSGLIRRNLDGRFFSWSLDRRLFGWNFNRRFFGRGFDRRLGGRFLRGRLFGRRNRRRLHPQLLRDHRNSLEEGVRVGGVLLVPYERDLQLVVGDVHREDLLD